jgi:UDPglucose--hexose-1-phosphate uridylyltransferase
VSERRYDPTTDEWVAFATHRQTRTFLPSRAECPLCPTLPGRPPTEVDRTAYDVVVFDNRFPSLSPDPPQPDVAATELYPVEPAYGRCEVIVFSDQHDATLASLGRERIRLLVEVWADRYAILGREPHVQYVMPFENRGEVIGVTLHHPHGQIYGYSDVPPKVLQHLQAVARYRERTGRLVWTDVVDDVLADRRRLVFEGRHHVAFVPFATRFPYELQIVPRRHVPSLRELDADARDELAELVHLAVRSYDGLFGFPLPYVMAIYSRPTGGTAPGGGSWDDLSQLRVNFFPPHREATKLKYLAGSELAAGAFITDVAPEDAAERLRKVLEEQ